MGRQFRRSRAQWAEIIETQSQSGLSAKKYCEQESIGLASFYQWRKRMDTEESERQAGGPVPEEQFIDMGQLGTDGSDISATAKSIIITLDLGGGLKLTVRRG